MKTIAGFHKALKANACLYKEDISELRKVIKMLNKDGVGPGWLFVLDMTDQEIVGVAMQHPDNSKAVSYRVRDVFVLSGEWKNWHTP